MKTVYVGIGNSDNKLSQKEWAAYQIRILQACRVYASQVHGEWFSEATSPYQNMCVCLEVTDAWFGDFKQTLTEIAGQHDQDSVAFGVAEVELLRPAP